MGAYGLAGATGKGPYRKQTANWKGGLAVGHGDAVFKDTGDSNSAGANYDKSAASYTGATDHPTTQTSFKAVFRGYSETRRTTAQTADGSTTTDGGILASGEFTKPCAALGSAANVGAYVGPAQGGSATTLDPQKVEIVTNVSYAIGRLTRPAAVGATELTFEIHPATFDGGVQAVS